MRSGPAAPVANAAATLVLLVVALLPLWRLRAFEHRADVVEAEVPADGARPPDGRGLHPRAGWVLRSIWAMSALTGYHSARSRRLMAAWSRTD